MMPRGMGVRGEGNVKTKKLEIRNSKQIPMIKKHKIPNKLGFRFLNFGFECCGLFRISIFGFRIFWVVSWRDDKI